LIIQLRLFLRRALITWYKRIGLLAQSLLRQEPVILRAFFSSRLPLSSHAS
jgi:hypothetical protein